MFSFVFLSTSMPPKLQKLSKSYQTTKLSTTLHRTSRGIREYGTEDYSVKTNGLFSGTTHRQHLALAIKASKARLSDGRRRPAAARRDRRDKAETILWRRFRSGPVIIVVEVERDIRSVFFDLSYRR